MALGEAKVKVREVLEVADGLKLHRGARGTRKARPHTFSAALKATGASPTQVLSLRTDPKYPFSGTKTVTGYRHARSRTCAQRRGPWQRGSVALCGERGRSRGNRRFMHGGGTRQGEYININTHIYNSEYFLRTIHVPNFGTLTRQHQAAHSNFTAAPP